MKKSIRENKSSVFFDAIRIKIASPEKILSWSSGEVTKPETINYRTFKPERDGLFCAKIFGPVKDWECLCGKYKRMKHRGIVCEKCGVEVIQSKVRRVRMGHIDLASPVCHIWFFKGTPSRIGSILDLSIKDIERVVYFESYIVTDPKSSGLKERQILTEEQYRKSVEDFGANGFVAKIGAEAVKDLLKKVDLDLLLIELKSELRETNSMQKRLKLAKRLRVVEAFRKSNNRPEWMVLDVIPVIPPELRPLVPLDGGRFATSDLNDLYRRVINRNNRLKKLMELNAPEIIIRNEKRMLQEAVDALFDNGRRGRIIRSSNKRPLKSLSDMIKGKNGRFRQNLLGKRVDYSGRSVIVAGPHLKMHQCGLPKLMALELFKPFLYYKLEKERGIASTVKQAKRMVEERRQEVWDVLEEVIREHPVLLNRAPTLHRLGIQAFEPQLIEGKAIQLHPLVCTAFNADFDGDQMAVHVPLSFQAQLEARTLMLSAYNILSPANGQPLAIPTQDMVLGIYYLTRPLKNAFGSGKIYSSPEEVIIAIDHGKLSLQAEIKVRIDGKMYDTSAGRVILYGIVPEGIDFEQVNKVLGKKELGKLVDYIYKKLGNWYSVTFLDNLKDLGFKYSTIAGYSICIDDMIIPKEKNELIVEAYGKVQEIERHYREEAALSKGERYNQIIDVWSKTNEKITDKLIKTIENLGGDASKENKREKYYNTLYVMSDSGARGSKAQIAQLAGMRGLMANASGKTVEVPVKSNFREGLSVMEYFTSSHGARKGLADTALRTADSGYLTRRLVDVSQDVIVREVDCGTTETTETFAIKDGNEVIEVLYDRIVGRYTIDPIVNPTTGEIIVEADSMIKEDEAEKIIAAGIETVQIRTVLNCKTNHGVCSKCYGRNLATGKEVNIGEAVGIIAAQSIGEPGTQLTMRTFHTGGVAGGDITQGLPRVEELFEARKPKGLAVITEITGRVEIDETGKRKEISIVPENGETEVYAIPYGSRIRVKHGQMVEAGDPLTQGSINPHDIVRVKGIGGVQDYIVKEVQRVYRMQGVDVNDKHIEVIVRQMLSKVKVEDPGDTELIPGGYEDVLTFDKCNEEAIAQGLKPAVAKRVLLGITKASLATESFLSAASFQETTRVLTEAAIKGKEDHLIGLKENVIIGKLIPAGTGMKRYKNIAVEKIQD